MGQKLLGFGGSARVGVIRKSRGFSLGSLLVVIIIVGAVALPAMKTIPSLLEYFSVKRAAKYAMDSSSNRADAIANFNKQAYIDRITSIKGDDLDITEDEGGRIRSIGFEYRTEVPIYGPLSFLITYSGT